MGGSIMGFCEQQRECVLRALRGDVWAGEDEDGGDLWQRAPREVCESAAMDAVDSLAWQLLAIDACGLAMDRYLSGHGIEVDYGEIFPMITEERRRFYPYLDAHGCDEVDAEQMGALPHE